MNTAVTTSNYKFLNGKLLLGDISSSNSAYYLFVGDHTNHTNTSIQPEYDNPANTLEYTYKNMIFGKKISSTDIMYLIRNTQWSSNTSYAMYDDQDPNLSTEDFFVITLEGSYYHIWKCLDNNQGANSVVVPLFSDISGANTNLYQTSDGYRWKYMTSVDDVTASKFKTPDYFPVVANTVQQNSAVQGAINIISVDSQGKYYNNYIDGTLRNTDLKINGDNTLYAISNTSVNPTNQYYADCILYITSGVASGQYAVISGYTSNSTGAIIQLTTPLGIDPQPGDSYQIRPKVVITSTDNEQTVSCVARALVNAYNSNSIYRTEVLEAGKDYRGATAYVSVNDVVGVSNVAVIRPIMSPAGGHGSNCYSELFSSDVSVCVTIANTETGTIPAANKYQQYGILKNPLFQSVQLNLNTHNATYTEGEVIYRVAPTVVCSNVTISSTSTYVNANPLQLVMNIVSCSVSATNTPVFGNSTIGTADGHFTTQFTAGDKIFITSNNFASSQIATVSTVNDDNTIQLTSNSLFSCTNCLVFLPNISTSVLCESVANATSLVVNNALGIFGSGDHIIGATSGAFANIASIQRSGVTKTFNTFVNLYKYSTTVSSGTFTQNEVVKLISGNTTAYVHSYDGTNLFVTNFNNGKFTTGDQLIGQTSGIIGTITAKFPQEIKYGSGEMLYVENISPVTRQVNQVESLSLVFNF